MRRRLQKSIVHMYLVFGSKGNGSEVLDTALEDEEKSQFRTRIKVEGTIDKMVFEEFKRIYALEVERAEAEDKVRPSVSHVLEMLLRKGIKAYKVEKDKSGV